LTFINAKSSETSASLSMSGLTIDDIPLCNSEPERAIPHYLIAHYWWAYTHPVAVRVFERPWLVNLILCGNYARLCNAVLAEFGESLPGRTLQVACVYGDLTPKLSRRVAQSGGLLDVVDVVPLQLQNLARKLPKAARTRLLHMDSAKLEAPSSRYDRALAFFLLHEQPAAHREKTLSELIRVVKRGGKIVIVDYALPQPWNPLRYLWRPLLATLEPFALDLWGEQITKWLPPGIPVQTRKELFFGGLYQKVVITVESEPAKAAGVPSSESSQAKPPKDQEWPRIGNGIKCLPAAERII
jgi:ubiquinone/menaquinone biosynthesis C-methylase UbiE